MQPDINPAPSQRRRLTPHQVRSLSLNPANMAFSFRTTGSRRPVDKQLTAINKSSVDATQVATTLVTVTFPCTIVGLRWDLDFAQDAGTGLCAGKWAIVVLRDGVTQPTIAVSDGAQFYNPEQDVMAFGSILIDNNTETKKSIGNTKTMRKMMGGDKLVWIYAGVATNTSSARGVIQFFCKT